MPQSKEGDFSGAGIMRVQRVGLSGLPSALKVPLCRARAAFLARERERTVQVRRRFARNPPVHCLNSNRRARRIATLVRARKWLNDLGASTWRPFLSVTRVICTELARLIIGSLAQAGNKT